MTPQLNDCIILIPIATSALNSPQEEYLLSVGAVQDVLNVLNGASFDKIMNIINGRMFY